MGSQTTPPTGRGIVGLEQNLQILCSTTYQLADLRVFGLLWMINGSVYGPLQVPGEFIVCGEVCDLNTLIIPVVQREMDGYTFQCVSVDYNTSTHYLGEITVLNATTLPEGFNGMHCY